MPEGLNGSNSGVFMVCKSGVLPNRWLRSQTTYRFALVVADWSSLGAMTHSFMVGPHHHTYWHLSNCFNPLSFVELKDFCPFLPFWNLPRARNRAMEIQCEANLRSVLSSGSPRMIRHCMESNWASQWYNWNLLILLEHQESSPVCIHAPKCIRIY